MKPFNRETLAEIAYNAYCEKTDWKSAVTGVQLPKWPEVRPEVKEAWKAVADEVSKYDYQGCYDYV